MTWAPELQNTIGWIALVEEFLYPDNNSLKELIHTAGAGSYVLGKKILG